MTPTANATARLRWFKSSRSGADNDCVEVAFTPGGVAMRDSKHPDGPVLHFGSAEWGRFLHGVRAGEFNQP